MAAIYEKLKKMREEAGLRQGQIADYLGVIADDMMGHNENGSCFKFYDLTEEACREYGPIVA